MLDKQNEERMVDGSGTHGVHARGRFSSILWRVGSDCAFLPLNTNWSGLGRGVDAVHSITNVPTVVFVW